MSLTTGVHRKAYNHGFLKLFSVKARESQSKVNNSRKS